MRIALAAPLWRRVALMAAAAGLAACGSAPLAPVPPAPPAPSAPASATPSPAPVAAPAPAPVAAPPAAAYVTDPYAARFPEPAVRFDTPAFSAGRSTFTTNPELQSLMQRVARERPTRVRVITLGRSQQGVPIEAWLFSTAAAAQPRAERPTVLLVGQQRGSDGATAEALIVVAQELATGRLQSVLDRVDVLVLPRANPDAAQSNQDTTASGIDLDRDHLLLRTPEAQALAQLVREYQPLVVVHAHEYEINPAYAQKFGGAQAHDALLQPATTGNLPPFVAKAAEEWLRQPLHAALQRQGLAVDWYHSASADPAERRLTMGSTRADNARNVQGLKSAVSLAVYSRGAGLGRQHLKRRVHTQVTAMSSVLASTAQRGADLQKLRQYVDAEVAAQACKGQAVVEAGPTLTEYTLQMLDAATGAPRPVTVSWDSALALAELKTRSRPCGYWLAADQGELVARLRQFGVRVEQAQAEGVVQGDTYTGAGADLKVLSSLLDVPVGSYYVPLSQPLANLVIAALEPDAPGSYFSAGLLSELGKVARVTTLPGMRLAVMP